MTYIKKNSVVFLSATGKTAKRRERRVDYNGAQHIGQRHTFRSRERSADQVVSLEAKGESWNFDSRANHVDRTLQSQMWKLRKRIDRKDQQSYLDFFLFCSLLRFSWLYYYLKMNRTADSSQLKEHQEEISILRNIVFRLNAELSDYQIRYPSPSLHKSIKVCRNH